MIELNVPKKYKERFKELELNIYEDFDTKYILHFANGWAYMGEYPIWYVNSKREALEYIKLAEPEKGGYNDHK